MRIICLKYIHIPMTDDLVPLVNDDVGDIILDISTKVRKISDKHHILYLMESRRRD